MSIFVGTRIQSHKIKSAYLEKNINICLDPDEFHIQIQPLYLIFIPNNDMYIICAVSKKYEDPIYGLDWRYYNGTLEFVKVRFIYYKGKDNKTICFHCGHPNVKIAEHCYQYYGKTFYFKFYINLERNN